MFAGLQVLPGMPPVAARQQTSVVGQSSGPSQANATPVHWPWVTHVLMPPLSTQHSCCDVQVIVPQLTPTAASVVALPSLAASFDIGESIGLPSPPFGASDAVLLLPHATSRNAITRYFAVMTPPVKPSGLTVELRRIHDHEDVVVRHSDTRVCEMRSIHGVGFAGFGVGAGVGVGVGGGMGAVGAGGAVGCTRR